MATPVTNVTRERGGIDPQRTLLPLLHSDAGLHERLVTRPRAASDAPTRVDDVLRTLMSMPEYAGEIVHVQDIPPRAAAFRQPAPDLSAWLREGLSTIGVDQLYLHQAEAVERARAHENIVVVSGTASGKTLCYMLPVLERLAASPTATALFLYPTKPLAQDQRGALGRLLQATVAAGAPDALRDIVMGTYDGDTPTAARRSLRDTGRVVLTNPDMLHAGILPGHPRWARFFAGLSLVVVDEIHSYRGIFGSHVAGVLRRLRRVAAHYGARPTFVLCSATVGNPEDLAGRLCGLEVRALSTDGAPRAGKRFVFWNPAQLRPNEPTRRSASVDATRVLTQLVRQDVPSIVFTKSRVAAELIYRYVRDALAPYRAPGGVGSLADRVSPYRGGYLPDERRAIEARLFSGDLRAVVSTNALELGIDVGGLDAAVLVGFPPTIASTWQQAGRAGRSTRDALAVVVAYEDPIDQYLMRHPQYFFARTPESAVLDPENATILRSQLACAAAELPLTDDDRALFGSGSDPVLHDLLHDGLLAEVRGRRFWSDPEAPARCVSLRMMSSDTVTIVEADRGERVLGTVDAISAPELVYPGAIYLHEGDSYFVRALDLVAKLALVERRDTDYYTQPVLDTALRVTGVRREASGQAESTLVLCDATVTWVTAWFRKIRYQTLESIGYGALELPPQTLETVALGFSLSSDLSVVLVRRGHDPREALAGVRNLFIAALPLLAMCEPSDVGGIVDSANRGVPTIFLYDRFPGGMGYAERAFARFDDLVRFAATMVRDCPCEAGCPSCVGLPVLRPATQQDPDLGVGWPIPSKRAARDLLDAMQQARAVEHAL